MSAAYAYVAIRGGRLHGMIWGNANPEHIRDFYRNFAGCDVRAATQEEWRRILEADVADRSVG